MRLRFVLTYQFSALASYGKIDNINMPRRIQFANGNAIDYIYTASGQKLRTIYYTASTQQKDSTEYFFGGLLTRKNNNLDKYLFDGGYYSFDNNTPTCHYYNRDHLGNIREVVSQTGDIEQVTHYYPFGAPYSDSSVTNPALQPYKYNSKEFDTKHSLNTYDYGARQYDPLLAVWHGVDPLCEKDYGTGTNVYCRNNPVKLKDPDGNNPIYDEEGDFLGTDNTGLRGAYYVMNRNYFTQGMAHTEVGNFATMGNISYEVEKRILNHYNKLPKRPDYDGFVTVGEGIDWAKSHPYALKNPTPDNMLYIDSSQLDFGSLSTTDFPKAGIPTPQNLFVNRNIIESIVNPELMATVYALGRVDIILMNRANGTVKIINNNATDYDWNVGGGKKRNAFIKTNNMIFGIDPKVHGFKTFYYGTGTLRK